MTNIYYPTIPNYTSTATGAMPLLYSIRDGIPGSFDALLLIVFFVLVTSQYYIIKNKSGRGKILTALLSSSIVLSTLSLFLALSYLVSYVEPIFYAFLAILFFGMYQLSDYW